MRVVGFEVLTSKCKKRKTLWNVASFIFPCVLIEPAIFYFSFFLFDIYLRITHHETCVSVLA